MRGEKLSGRVFEPDVGGVFANGTTDQRGAFETAGYLIVLRGSAADIAGVALEKLCFWLAQGSGKRVVRQRIPLADFRCGDGETSGDELRAVDSFSGVAGVPGGVEFGK